MWISRAHFDLIRDAAATFRAWHEERMRDKDAQIAALTESLTVAVKQESERMQAVADERFKVLAESLAESRAQFDQRLADKDQFLRSQEARLAVLETERRELTERLWTREQERTRPPEPLPPAPEDNWESIMRKQIEELNAPEAA